MSPDYYTLSQLLGYRLAQVRHCFGSALDHVTAVISAGRHILVNAVIALDQFCKPEISQFAVCFGAADIDPGNYFLNGAAALRAFGERFVIDRLPKIKYISQGTWCLDMFILINRHRLESSIEIIHIIPEKLKNEKLSCQTLSQSFGSKVCHKTADSYYVLLLGDHNIRY